MTDRTYTSVDYLATVKALDEEIKQLDAKRTELLRDIDFPHIAQGRIKALEPRVLELEQELQQALAQLQYARDCADATKLRAKLETVYAKLDSKRDERKLYHDEYVRLADIEKATTTPQAEFQKMVAKHGTDSVLAMLQAFLDQHKANAPTVGNAEGAQ